MKKGHLKVAIALWTVAGARGEPPQDSRRRLDRSTVRAKGLLTIRVTMVDARLVTVICSASADPLTSFVRFAINGFYQTFS